MPGTSPIQKRPSSVTRVTSREVGLPGPLQHLAGMSENGWKWLEMAWNWLEMEGTAGNGWKLIKMKMMMLENQMGWPYHSFDCVLLFRGCSPPRPTCHMSYVMCHKLHVTCHVSHVTCHKSCVMFFFFFFFSILVLQSGWASWWRVCYQRGLLCLVFRN